MDTLQVIVSVCKVLLIGIITPLGAALVIWELVQAALGRPTRAAQPALQDAEDEA